ncbi:Putative Luciferase-like domain-containing protein [Septoria linicola]|uniref:Luciferase-like domain-containing protein n=1 Tax=Septoria linicola TaxID=215465 RepID=A0A9Q9EIT5_9PEZI|nr:Putative Luciferase-like domain-containing protein [Septoria linicola]
MSSYKRQAGRSELGSRPSPSTLAVEHSFKSLNINVNKEDSRSSEPGQQQNGHRSERQAFQSELRSSARKHRSSTPQIIDGVHHANGVNGNSRSFAGLRQAFQSELRSSNSPAPKASRPKKHILLNAFDMSTIGHLSPGQWKDPQDRSTTKRRLDYWIGLAKLLERGDINALFLADTYGGYDTYNDSLDDCIRRAAQWPMTDPTIPISAMAAVTKNLAFGITASTSFEPPFLLAKRFSTLDHMTQGRIAWNIVTSWKKAAFKAIGIDSPIEHDERYLQADEYMRVLYKLWEGSWSDDTIIADAENDAYFDPDRIRHIKHHGKYYDLESRHITDPSPQRTPFLFQAGTSSAGSQFASKHAEAIFVSAHSPAVLAPKIANIRKLAAQEGRDPRSVKFFGTFTPIVGRTDEEAWEKFEKIKKNASTVGGLVLFSGWTGIDISKIPLDQRITEADSKEANKVTSMMSAFTTTSKEVPEWTPRVIAEKAAIGGLGPVGVGSPATVADEMQRWIEEADLDGFNLGYVTTPGTFEEVVDLLIPELRRRGLYPEKKDPDAEAVTIREKVYGKGQSSLRDDHTGSRYKYDVYQEDPPHPSKVQAARVSDAEPVKLAQKSGDVVTQSGFGRADDIPAEGPVLRSQELPLWALENLR